MLHADYILFDDGRIAMYNRSYWDEILKIYNNLELETTIQYIGDMETTEWKCTIDGKKTDQSTVSKILRELVFVK